MTEKFIIRGPLAEVLDVSLSANHWTFSSDNVVVLNAGKSFSDIQWELTWNISSKNTTITRWRTVTLLHTASVPFGRQKWIYAPENSEVIMVLTRVSIIYLEKEKIIKRICSHSASQRLILHVGMGNAYP